MVFEEVNRRTKGMRVAKKKGTNTWKVTYQAFQPAQEGLREALCTLGNGYFATRGTAPEASASRIHYPGTYMAGVYNKLPTAIAGKTIYNEDLVNCPNWLPVAFRIDKGEWISLEACKIRSFYQELDMKRGVLIRKTLLEDKKGRRTQIETARIVHMSNPHCAALTYTFTPENYEGTVTLRTGLDGTVINWGVARYRDLNSKHLRAGSAGTCGKNCLFLSVETTKSKIKIALAAKISLTSDGREIKRKKKTQIKKKKAIWREIAFQVERRKAYTLEKVVTIFTSRDPKVKNPLTAARAMIKGLPWFRGLFASHKKTWEDLWHKYDITIEGDEFSQQVIRLHTFHLLQSASQHNVHLDAGIMARGLHGEAYRGHVFWDELYVMPFYDFREPPVSRALLMYRYRRLNQARAYAKANGYHGSMFPWQSGSSGEEETQIIHLNPLSGKWDPDDSCIQRHVSFAIAYNVWQYWRRTKDTDFLIKYGAELIVSIAQFGASLAKFNQKTGRYHTDGLMGPDEFHERLPGAAKAGFKDNAYTNFLISWTLTKAQEALALLPKKNRTRIEKKLGLTEEDIVHWEDVSRKMNIIINSNGIISQFDGYFNLKELDWDAYRAKYDNIRRMDRILKAEKKSPNAYKVAKQADVLMLFYILPLSEVRDVFWKMGYMFEKKILKKNYEYYLKRTSHGSTLSKVVHCYISHILGHAKEAERWFNEVLRSDMYDTQGGTTREGIHAGVMGGSIHMILRGYAGYQFLEDRIVLTPRLPRNWQKLKIRFLFQGKWVTLTVTKKETYIRINAGKKKDAVPIEINQRLKRYSCGTTHIIKRVKQDAPTKP